MSKAVSRILPALLLSALCVAACAKKPDDSQKGKGGPANVGFVVVTTQPLTLTQDLSGRTSAYLVSDVRPQVGGIVKARQFTEGALVSAGQSLYQIDPATYQATLNSAQAGLQQAQATLGSARTRWERAQQLITIKAISQQDYDDAETAFKQAEAAVALQSASVDQARINLNYTRVAAPISGRIGKSSVTPGALVTANQSAPLATVQDLSRVYVDIVQSSGDVLKLKKALMSGEVGAVDHADVELTLDDGSAYPLKGRLQFADVSVNPSTGAVTLRALFDNPDGLLLPGMYVRARIATGRVDQAVLIPQGAVILDPKGGASVLVAGNDGKAHSRAITLGQMVGPNWQVTSGLAAGDKVIVEGAMRLKPEGPIKAHPVQAKPGQESAR